MDLKQKHPRMVRFASIGTGDPFRYAGTLFMRVSEGRTLAGHPTNAVRLNNGYFAIFSDTDEVEPVAGAFVEEGA